MSPFHAQSSTGFQTLLSMKLMKMAKLSGSLQRQICKSGKKSTLNRPLRSSLRGLRKREKINSNHHKWSLKIVKWKSSRNLLQKRTFKSSKNISRRSMMDLKRKLRCSHAKRTLKIRREDLKSINFSSQATFLRLTPLWKVIQEG